MPARESVRPLSEELTIAPWIDHDTERHGHAPTSLYVETEYLSRLGPTTTLLYRRLGSWAAMSDEGMVIPTRELAGNLGVSRGLSANAPLPKAVGRLVMFEAAYWDDDVLAVRRALPNLVARGSA